MNIIAEIGINHNGNLEIAEKLINMAAQCGCNFVKFQKRDINIVYTQEFLDSPRESPWGKTQRDQKAALELSLEQYEDIDSYCYDKGIEGIEWLASCWDMNSLALIENFSPPLHKIASPMLTNRKFVREVAKLKRLTLISTGMSDLKDVCLAVDIFEEEKCDYVLMHCVSEYPCPDERINLAGMLRLKKQFCLGEHFQGVGYSNHSPGIESCVGAAYLGAEWLEVHITLDRAAYGSDQAASLEHRGLELVCKYAKNAKTIMGDGKKVITEAEKMNAEKLRYWRNHG